MIVDVEPVANVLAASVHVDRPRRECVQNGERNQLLRKLVRSVVVRAVRDDHGQPVRSMPGAYEMIRAGLAGRVRRAGVVGRVFVEVARRTERAVNLVGGNVDEPKARARSSGSDVPVPTRFRRGALNVPTMFVRNEIRRRVDRPVDVRLRRQMKHGVGLISLEDAGASRRRSQMSTALEVIVRVAPRRRLSESRLAAYVSLSTFTTRRRLTHKRVDDGRSDEAGAASNEVHDWDCVGLSVSWRRWTVPARRSRVMMLERLVRLNHLLGPDSRRSHFACERLSRHARHGHRDRAHRVPRLGGGRQPRSAPSIGRCGRGGSARSRRRAVLSRIDRSAHGARSSDASFAAVAFHRMRPGGRSPPSSLAGSSSSGCSVSSEAQVESIAFAAATGSAWVAAARRSTGSSGSCRSRCSRA